MKMKNGELKISYRLEGGGANFKMNDAIEETLKKFWFNLISTSVGDEPTLKFEWKIK